MISSDRNVTSPQRDTARGGKQKKATHYQNAAGEWIRIPASPTEGAAILTRNASIDSLVNQNGTRRTRTRAPPLSEPLSPSAQVLELLSPEAAQTLFADEHRINKEVANPLARKAQEEKRAQARESLIDNWDHGAIYDIRDIQKVRPSSPLARRQKLEVEPETVEITLGNAVKPAQTVAPDAGKVKLIRVRGKDGKVVLVNPADLGFKVSPAESRAKATVEAQEEVAAVKPEALKPEAELSREKELESITKELAKVKEEAENLGDISGSEDSEGNKRIQADEVERLQELRDQLNKIKSAREDAPWQKVNAELAKAQRQLERSPAGREGSRFREEDDHVLGRRSSAGGRRVREEAIVSPQLEDGLGDTGIRRRRSMALDDDGEYMLHHRWNDCLYSQIPWGHRLTLRAERMTETVRTRSIYRR